MTLMELYKDSDCGVLTSRLPGTGPGCVSGCWPWRGLPAHAGNVARSEPGRYRPEGGDDPERAAGK